MSALEEGEKDIKSLRRFLWVEEEKTPLPHKLTGTSFCHCVRLCSGIEGVQGGGVQLKTQGSEM